MRLILPSNRKYLSVLETIDLLAEQTAIFAFKQSDDSYISASMREDGWVQDIKGTWSHRPDVPRAAREKHHLDILREKQKKHWTSAIRSAVVVGRLVVRDAAGLESEAEDDILNLFIKTKEISAWLSGPDSRYFIVFDKKPVVTEAESPVQRVQELERVEPDDDPATEPKSAPQVGRTTTHKLNEKERRVLDAEIEIAKSRALNPSDYHSVWAEIVKMASAKEGCFIEYSHSLNAAKYRSGNGVGTFTKANLKDRMKREAARRQRAK
ncbi:hypothetical protein SAMN04515617_105147 [Collimonas sp. OK242]|uniref:hypothetical protein n=1 Tax=Collimonas sp. OK242 TaxID=1798195 RepID=UPI000895A8F8|nr:hypothetical protein [Collimonas sp. OK242]SDX62932.1 hypothetical protein SAMN04515617_105147 [Collimonas sp. OK242]